MLALSVSQSHSLDQYHTRGDWLTLSSSTAALWSINSQHANTCFVVSFILVKQCYHYMYPVYDDNIASADCLCAIFIPCTFSIPYYTTIFQWVMGTYADRPIQFLVGHSKYFSSNSFDLCRTSTQGL